MPVDPHTGAQYEYALGDGLSFTLCATFEASSVGDQRDTMAYGGPYGVKYYGSWKHDTGRACFTRTIDPDLYPLIGATPVLVK